MQEQKPRQFIAARTGFRRFGGAGILCLGLAILAVSACGQPIGGITAMSTVDFKGNNIWIDSFSSADPAHSVWQTNQLFHGQPYGVWSSSLSLNPSATPSRTDHATVATDGSIMNVGNAFIAGYVNVAPGGTVAVGSVGSVGDMTWALVNQTHGIQAGHMFANMNQVFSSRTLPVPTNLFNGQANWWPVPQPTNVINIGCWYSNSACYGGAPYTNYSGGYHIGGVTYAMVITNRPHTNSVYYALNHLTGSLFIDCPDVVLYLTNGISYSGANALTLNTNADVQIYTTGDISMSGYGVITNLTRNSHALAIYDVVGYSVNMNFGANGYGVGYVYAPSSDIAFSGGGNNTYDVVGAIFCKTIAINGHYNFHFDESLAGPLAPLIESQPTNQIVPAGSNATFAVTVVWLSSPTNYQWYFNQTSLLDGATNASLTLTNVQLTDAGIYSVVVTNRVGVVTSTPASLVVYTDATPTLSAPVSPVDGSFQFSIAGVTGLNYVVQGSTNLVDWVPVGTNLSPFLFTDLYATNYPQRFYRAVSR